MEFSWWLPLLVATLAQGSLEGSQDFDFFLWPYTASRLRLQKPDPYFPNAVISHGEFDIVDADSDLDLLISSVAAGGVPSSPALPPLLAQP